MAFRALYYLVNIAMREVTEIAAADCHIGVIGLAVMGQNLVLNLNDHGYMRVCSIR
ncbi:MAG: hypothetical protein QOH96_931 [Blastocatellia bacterium]|nr:hypothetical protein [Blastocatellia bacterium]